MEHTEFSELPGYPYLDTSRHHRGRHPGNGNGNGKIKAMLSSALIFLTVVAWADVIQEYLILKDPPEDPIDEKKQADKMYRRFIFAATISIATFAIVGWIN
jgi:hypothetical protein